MGKKLNFNIYGESEDRLFGSLMGWSFCINEQLKVPDSGIHFFTNPKDGKLRIWRKEVLQIPNSVYQQKMGKPYYKQGQKNVVDSFINQGVLSLNPDVEEHLIEHNKSVYIINEGFIRRKVNERIRQNPDEKEDWLEEQEMIFEAINKDGERRRERLKEYVKGNTLSIYI